MKIKKYFEIKRGTRQIESLRMPGDVPLVVAKAYGNGIAQLIKPRFKIYPKNSITIDMFGNCFFQSEEFCADDNVHVLINEKLTLFSGLYIVSIMKKYLGLKFSYGRQFRLGDANNMDVPIPFIDGELDIIKMEKDSIELFNPLIDKKKNELKLIEKSILDDKIYNKPSGISYLNFNLTDLFFFERKDTKSSVPFDENMPRVSMQNYNNGVVTTFDWNGSVYAGKTIAVNDWGIPNYQDKPFVMSGRDSLTLRLKERDLNENIALYIMAMIKMNNFKFGYSRKFNAGAIKRFDLKLSLPESEGKPDWAMIEKITLWNKSMTVKSKKEKTRLYINAIKEDRDKYWK